MAQTFFNAVMNVTGPWWLTKKHLEELDAIVDKYFSKMVAESEEAIKREIDEEYDRLIKERRKLLQVERVVEKGLDALEADPSSELEQSAKHAAKRGGLKSKGVQAECRRRAEQTVRRKHSYYPNERSATIEVQEGSKIQGESFAEILRQPSLEMATPTEVKMEVKANGATCTVGFRSFAGLMVQYYPENSPVVSELFASLREWALRNQPSRWQRIWVRLDGLQWLLFFLLLVVVSWVAAPEKKEPPYVKEAHVILERGMTEADERRAVEILLAVSTGYKPAGSAVVADSRNEKPVLLFLLISFLMTAILTVQPPKFLVEVGRGVRSWGRWNWWIRLVSKVIPAFLIAQLLIPVGRYFVVSWLSR